MKEFLFWEANSPQWSSGQILFHCSNYYCWQLIIQLVSFLGQFLTATSMRFCEHYQWMKKDEKIYSFKLNHLGMIENMFKML